MPITKLSDGYGEAVFRKTEESEFKINIVDCNFSFYHSDASTPEDRQGWYCQVYHRDLGNFTFRLEDIFQEDDVSKAVNDINSMFAVFVNSFGE